MNPTVRQFVEYMLLDKEAPHMQIHVHAEELDSSVLYDQAVDELKDRELISVKASAVFAATGVLEVWFSLFTY